MRRTVIVLAAGLLAGGCMSVWETDMRLTAIGRAAVPERGQPLVQQVQDAAACREGVIDSLFFVGTYTLYNPFVDQSSQAALRRREREMARCLADRGYAVPGGVREEKHH